MDSNRKGNIGEAKVIAYFIEQGYDVYTAFGTAAKFDLVVHKNGVLQKVSVKSTSQKSSKSAWVVRIKQTTRNGETPFDNAAVDLLAVYIAPEDRIVIVEAKSIQAKLAYSVKALNGFVV